MQQGVSSITIAIKSAITGEKIDWKEYLLDSVVAYGAAFLSAGGQFLATKMVNFPKMKRVTNVIGLTSGGPGLEPAKTVGHATSIVLKRVGSSALHEIKCKYILLTSAELNYKLCN